MKLQLKILELALQEGILGGISSGAAFTASLELSKKAKKMKES